MANAKVTKLATAKAPKANVKVVNMTFVKSTKGTHVYGSDDEDAVCRQVYLSKSALGEDAPASIKMTIELS